MRWIKPQKRPVLSAHFGRICSVVCCFFTHWTTKDKQGCGSFIKACFRKLTYDVYNTTFFWTTLAVFVSHIKLTEWAAVRVEEVLITWCQDIWLQVQTPPVWACWGLWGGWIRPGQGVRPKGSLQVLTLHLPAEKDRCTCGFEWSSTDMNILWKLLS